MLKSRSFILAMRSNQLFYLFKSIKDQIIFLFRYVTKSNNFFFFWKTKNIQIFFTLQSIKSVFYFLKLAFPLGLRLESP